MISFIVIFVMAASTQSSDRVVLGGQQGPVAERLQNKAHADGWNVELKELDAGIVVAATSDDGHLQWSVTLSRFQAFQAVSLASITYGTIARDSFYQTVWPLAEGCQTANS